MRRAVAIGWRGSNMVLYDSTRRGKTVIAPHHLKGMGMSINAHSRRLLILALVVILCIALDQATKVIARATLATAEPLIFAGGLARLAYAENPGAFLSLGADLPPDLRFWIFAVLATVLLVALAVYALRASAQTPLLTLVAVSLFVAGGVGNLIDRLVNDGRDTISWSWAWAGCAPASSTWRTWRSWPAWG